MPSHFVKAADRADLGEKGRTVARIDGKQIVLFQVNGAVFACNNRCPHEGYPLREGSLDGCTLTCNWHNWKFDLETGANLLGGDRVRTYPVELRGDEIWIDVADPPPAARQAEVLGNIRAALDEDEENANRAYSRLARELARYRLADGDPVDAIAAAFEATYDRFEFGWTHAMAGAADWLALYDERADDPESQLICLAEALGHLAFDVIRQPHFPYSQGESPYDEDALVDAVDREDEETAVALVRGGLAAGLGFADFERGLTRAALLHYNDFGHSLIYVMKTGALIDRFGPGSMETMLLPLVRSLIFASREDQIPEFRFYATALQDWGKDGNGEAPQIADFRGLNIKAALKQTAKLGGAPGGALHRALIGANAANMLTFDAAHEQRTDVAIADNVGWLDFTHAITFGNAVRAQCSKFPELWPAGLLQMACFAGRNAPYTKTAADNQPWSVTDRQAFYADSIDRILDHGCGEYIVSVHLLKTFMAARAEAEADPDDEAAPLLLASVNRFLNAPLKRRHGRRTARQAIDFVALDG